MGDERVQAGDDLGDMGQVARIVEAAIEVGEAQRAGDDGVERENLAQRTPAVRRLERGPLDDVVGLLPREAGPSTDWANRAEKELARGNKTAAANYFEKAGEAAQREGSTGTAKSYNMRAYSIRKSFTLNDR